jgi:glutamate carboxypeptidase
MVKDQRVVELLAIASENAEFLGFTLKDTATGGGSDGNLVSAFGTPVLDGMGPVGGLVHSDEEYLELDTLTQRCKLLALTLLDYTS